MVKRKTNQPPTAGSDVQGINSEANVIPNDTNLISGVGAERPNA